jgi:hypothetical protein
MKKLILPILIVLANPVFSQGKDSYFIFDADWNPVKNIKKRQALSSNSENERHLLAVGLL